MTTPILLTEKDFFSKGSHKKCYLYPGHPQYCIKIPYNKGGIKDIKREVFYLTHILKQHGPQSGILPHFFGKIHTNLTDGYVFEMIRDFDGKISQNIEVWLATPHTHDQLLALRHALLMMRDSMLQHNIISMSIYSENILYQKTDPQHFRLMLINDMGSSEIIPLEYFITPLAKSKIKRYWNRFMTNLSKRIDPTISAMLADGLFFTN